jgi:hypothetical protein
MVTAVYVGLPLAMATRQRKGAMKVTTQTDDRVFVPTRFVFGGLRVDADGDRTAAFVREDNARNEHGELREQHWDWSRGKGKEFRFMIPGSVYEIPFWEDDKRATIRTGQAAYQGRCEDEDLRLELVARDRAAHAADDLRKLKAKDKRDDPLYEWIDQASELLKKLPPNQRRPMLTLILERLSRAMW